MKTRKQIDRERDHLRRMQEQLDKEEQSLESDPIKEVADALHTAFCHDQHDKVCSYYYES
jgi:hypothetical protein